MKQESKKAKRNPLREIPWISKSVVTRCHTGGIARESWEKHSALFSVFVRSSHTRHLMPRNYQTFYTLCLIGGGNKLTVKTKRKNYKRWEVATQMKEWSWRVVTRGRMYHTSVLCIFLERALSLSLSSSSLFSSLLFSLSLAGDWLLVGFAHAGVGQ